MDTGMLAILSDCKPTIRVIEKLGSGTDRQSKPEYNAPLKSEKTDNWRSTSRGSKDTRTSRATKQQINEANKPLYSDMSRKEW